MRAVSIAVLLLTFTTPLTAQAAPPACMRADALQSLIQAAQESNSEGLVVLHDGRLLVDTTFGKPRRPIYIASAGKSLASMGIMRLLELGMLDSLDQTVASLYPEWRQGRKAGITVRQLLAHTSGLQNHPNASVELEPPPTWRVPDVVKLALAAEVTEDPGSAWRYNNKAVALLGGVIERASGLRMDAFFEREFFQPLGITEYDWIRDDAGQPTAHGAFVLTARDFAKFGEVMLGRGELDGRRYFAAAWVDSSFAVSQPFDERSGLLWWRLPAHTRYTIDGVRIDSIRARVADSSFVRAVETLRDRRFEDRAAYEAAMHDALGPNWQQRLNETLLPLGLSFARRTYSDEVAAYYADGFRGNYLVVIPEARVVAARVRGPGEDYDARAHTMDDFIERVAALAAGCRDR